MSSTKPTPSTSGSSTAAFPPPTIPSAFEPTQPSAQFMDLPFELREMIWKLALPGPRELRVPIGLDWYYKKNRINFSMPLSQVCSESRRIMLESGYKLAHGSDAGPYREGGFYFKERGDSGLPDVGVWFCEERGDAAEAWFFEEY